MDTSTLRFPKLSKRLIIILAAVLIGIIFIFSMFGWINNLQKGSVQREVRLSRQYESLKTGLDAFLTTAREQAGVTTAQSATFDKIMLDAVQGRYQGKEGGGTTAQPGSGTLFSAIAEAYPNLDALNSSYGRILDTISSGRTSFSNNQQKLQDELREYDQWRKSGIIQSAVISGIVGVPTNNLTVNNGTPQHGQAAYDVMSNVITSGLTQKSFSSGKLEAQDFFGQ
jgi:hypothetical protein